MNVHEKNVQSVFWNVFGGKILHYIYSCKFQKHVTSCSSRTPLLQKRMCKETFSVPVLAKFLLLYTLLMFWVSFHGLVQSLSCKYSQQGHRKRAKTLVNLRKKKKQENKQTSPLFLQ